MKDFRWRTRSRRPRTQPLLALPSWVGTVVLVVLVLGACGAAATLVQPEIAKFMADAQMSAPPTDTAIPRLPTRTPGSALGATVAVPTRAADTPAAPVATEATTAAPAPTQPAPADTPVPTAKPAIIMVGATVQVGGTNGIGLSLRADPTIQGHFLRAAADGERLTVVDGPIQADNYTWWKVHNDQGVDGWGVADYMTVVTP